MTLRQPCLNQFSTQNRDCLSSEEGISELKKVG
jgi:hypothetical protein